MNVRADGTPLEEDPSDEDGSDAGSEDDGKEDAQAPLPTTHALDETLIDAIAKAAGKWKKCCCLQPTHSNGDEDTGRN